MGRELWATDCWRLGKHCREVSPHAHPAQMLSCNHLVVTNVGNKECKVKGMSDTIQYNCFYVLNLKSPPPLRFQQTALYYTQFMFRVLPNPARHRHFLNKKAQNPHSSSKQWQGGETEPHGPLPTRTAPTCWGLNMYFNASDYIACQGTVDFVSKPWQIRRHLGKVSSIHVPTTDPYFSLKLKI